MNAKLQQAWSAFRAGRFPQAHALCIEVIKAEPRLAEPYALLGAIALQHKVFDKAADLFGRAFQLAPSNGAYAASLAQSFLGLNRMDQARTAATRALKVITDDAQGFDTLGVVFSRLDDQTIAADCFRRAVSLSPGNTSYLFNLGWAEQFIGDFAAAEAAYRQALALDPDMDRTYSALVRLAKQTPDSNFAPQLESLFRRVTDPRRRLAIGHALAKTFEDLGQDQTSLEWLVRAKAAYLPKAAVASARRTDLFEAAVGSFPIEGGHPVGDPSSKPIFVFGLPRTGTTLVERILSSHPEVTSVGETMAFALATRRLAGAPTAELIDAEILRAARGIAPAALGAAFLQATNPGLSTPRYSEKSPLNFLYAGLIHQALPNARMICLRREAMDSCLANYRQSFAVEFPYYDHTYDMTAMAEYYVAFDRLMAHWRAVLPADRFLEVRYEDVVSDQEAQTRRLLAFCDLDWDERSLNFHENTAPVSTASAVQVRQPVYATSIARWKRYGSGLDPMADVLRNAGLLD